MNSQNPAPPLRPVRPALPDFAGRPVSLPDSPQSWRLLDTPGMANKNAILLLGPGPGNVPSFIPHGAKVYWLDAPNTFAALAGARTTALENCLQSWQKTNPAEVAGLARVCQTWHYQPGLRLEPEFWGPILADLDIISAPGLKNDRPSASSPKSAWLPGSQLQLLHQEIKSALSTLGYAKIHEGICAPCNAKNLLQTWGGQPPGLAISINFRGLDSEGHIFHLCREMEVPLFIWLVDNPWHILSAIRLPWWRQANIFVTDASFINSLREYGATTVRHLPLAVAPHMWRDNILPNPPGPPLFIGRSAFPDKQRFFRGVKIPPAIYDLAKNKKDGTDWHWWRKALAPRLWPGFEGRGPGLGAENCSAQNRAAWIAAALPHGLEVVGDEGWRGIIADAPLHAPVDYYGALPDIYNQSAAVLNATSLLLPASLNQRHFDVWAAGGLLLSDKTEDLDIFPAQLVAPMLLPGPADFGARLNYFKKNPAARLDLIAAWRELLKNGHAYTDRLLSMTG